MWGQFVALHKSRYYSPSPARYSSTASTSVMILFINGWCHRSFQHIYNIFYEAPKEKVRVKARLCGGQETEPALPIHLHKKQMSRDTCHSYCNEKGRHVVEKHKPPFHLNICHLVKDILCQHSQYWMNMSLLNEIITWFDIVNVS